MCETVSRGKTGENSMEGHAGQIRDRCVGEIHQSRIGLGNTKQHLIY